MPKPFELMSVDETIKEAARRQARRDAGLPLHSTPQELEVEKAEKEWRLEKEIQADVVKHYRAAGFVVYSLSQPRATKQTPGIGDLWVFALPYRVAFWHETKTPTGKLRPDQAEFHEFAHLCNVDHVVGGVAACEKKIDELRKLPTFGGNNLTRPNEDPDGRTDRSSVPRS